jgi:hypothetical protein
VHISPANGHGEPEECLRPLGHHRASSYHRGTRSGIYVLFSSMHACGMSMEMTFLFTFPEQPTLEPTELLSENGKHSQTVPISVSVGGFTIRGIFFSLVQRQQYGKLPTWLVIDL